MSSSVTSKFKKGDKVRCVEVDQGQWLVLVKSTHFTV